MRGKKIIQYVRKVWWKNKVKEKAINLEDKEIIKGRVTCVYSLFWYKRSSTKDQDALDDIIGS